MIFGFFLEFILLYYKDFFCFKFDCLKKWVFVELGIIRNFKLVFFFFRYLLVLNFLFLRGYNVLEMRLMWVIKGSKIDYRF